MDEDTAQPGSEHHCRMRRLVRPSWNQRKRMLRIEAWVFVVLCYVLITFAYLWPQDFRNPSVPYVIAALAAFLLQTFLFHMGLVLTAIVVITAWVRQWRLALATLPLILIAMGPVVWQYRPRSKPAVAGEIITVMSANLLMINKNTEPIIGEIKAAAPDILLLQEYTDHWHAALQQAVGPDYPHVRYIPRNDSFGSAICSRRPLVEKPTLFLPLGEGAEPQIRAVIQVAGRDVAFYNIHLLPPRRLQYTITNRAQFADLLEQLADDPLPVVVAGDFNFTENSPFARALGRAGLVDAFSVGGWGRGTTWPVHSFFRWVPSIRLDHIYLGGGLTCVECRTGQGKGSDHRPVIAKIAFAK